MPNYRDYQKSVAAEFNAYKDRVRNIIDDKHWGMDGHHKEVVLMNYLKRVLPKHLSVGTGFIKTKDGITTQIDIIVYDNRYPTLFEEGDFVIAIPESVVGIVEVKSNIRASSLCEIIKKANENGSIICGKTSKTIFNGVFAYASVGSNDAVLNSLDKITYDENWKKSILPWQNFLNNLLNCVNYICLDNNRFIELLVYGEEGDSAPCYRLYEMPEELSIAYFISHLQKAAYDYENKKYPKDKIMMDDSVLYDTHGVPMELDKFWFPLSAKEMKKCFRGKSEQRLGKDT